MSNTRALWLALVLAGCGGGYSTAPPPGPPPPPPPPPGSGNPSVANVAMNSTDDGYGSAVNSFNPTSVTVAVSGTVSWSNSTGILHNVTFTTGGSPANIPSFGAGSVSRSFATGGTFGYQCTNHAGMSGQVIVQ